MGCISSRPEFPSDVHPNIFTVTTVARPDGTNSSTRDSATGHLEVTSNEIILHRRGYDAVHWPLQYIRRYGYENHLFSFESGRRCESGPGIFTFRCRHARELFLLVQNSVQEARTPPVGSGSNGLPSRVRSGSAASHNQFGFHFAPTNGSSLESRSMNDYLQPERPNSIRATTPSPLANGNPCSNSRSSPATRVPGADSTLESGIFDDADGSQVFVEITPLRTHAVALRHRVLNEDQRQRLNSTRSQVSSAASEHSLSVNFAHGNQRPQSIEFILSDSSPQDGDSNAFISPQHPSPSGSPPSSYYVNVQPGAKDVDDRPKKIDLQELLNSEKHVNGAWKPPARSQSLGSPSVPGPGRRFVSPNADGAYVSIVHSKTPSPCTLRQDRSPKGRHRSQDGGKATLDYVTLDVGGSSATNPPSKPCQHRGQSPMTTSDVSFLNSGRFPSCRLFASSLTSVSEVGSSRNETEQDEATAACNYVRIDCTRTKALRETVAAAHMQRHSTSCSASSSEITIAGDQIFPVGKHTRHNSAAASNADKPSPLMSSGRKS